MNKYKTFGPRFLAAIVDGIIFIPVTYFFDWLIALVSDNKFLLLLLTITSMSIFLFYSIYMHGKYGQTLGKRFARIKIVSFPNEQPITYRHAYYRDLPYIILIGLDILISTTYILNGNFAENYFVGVCSDFLGNAGLFWLIIELFSLLFNKQNRAIHDLIAKTVVVRED